jgi:serine/threonine-protein kinase
MIGARLGNWIIDEEIGRGGMGDVYLAHAAVADGGGPRRAALKVLAGALAQDPGFVARFEREGEVLRRLEHPHIVRFYEAGTQDGQFFYAMEYVNGRNLEELLHEEGRLEWPAVIDLALQVCLALKHAHDRGVIHRDIKPSNLLLQAADGAHRGATGDEPETYALAPDPSATGPLGGVVKLTDFGIAKVFAATHLTATGGVVGTAEYLSPEQAVGKPVTKRSDLYSLGVVLYTLLTGRTPFQGEGVVDLLHKHRFAQFERPSRLVPEIPRELEEAVCQLLEKEPARRPADAGVLHRQLGSVRRKLERKAKQTGVAATGRETLKAPSAAVGAPGRGPGPATLMSRLMRRELEDQNRGGPLSRFFNRPFVLVVLLLLTVGGIVWAFWPVSAETLFRRADAVMHSENPDDWESAWDDLDTLEHRYPDNPHRDQVAQYKQQILDHRAEWQAARDARRAGVTTEAQWFYQEGLRLQQRGDTAAAEKQWRNVVRSFRGVPAEEKWVRLAEQQLDRPGEHILSEEKRWAPVREALKRARTLRDEGKAEDAEAIWQGLEALYSDDPSAKAILEEVRRDRGH